MRVSKIIYSLAAFSIAGSLAQTVLAEDYGVPLHGFADVGGGYSTTKDQDASKRKGFATGGVDLYLTPYVGDRIKGLLEIAIDPDSSGAVALDVERIQLGYTFSDWLTVWAGRFHTPLGYWNTAYHHGSQLQTPIARPRFLDFEDAFGVLPVHSVGLWASGSVKAGEGRFTYDLHLTNGAKVATDGAGTFSNLDPNIFRDDNGSAAVGTNMGYKFGGDLDGFKLGVHYLFERLDTAAAAPIPVALQSVGTYMNLYGGYAVYDNHDFEVIFEGYGFFDKASNANKYLKSMAAFGQVAYTTAIDLVPFFRFEKAKFDQDDAIFGSQTNGASYVRLAGGLRYNLNDRACIKAEYFNTKIEDNNAQIPQGRSHKLMGQFAVRF
jgi:hypothetical protein